MPSVSAAIGYDGFTNIIWFLFIIAHAPFRFKIAKTLNETYKALFKSFKNNSKLLTDNEQKYSNSQLKYMKIFYFSHLFNKIEIIGLLILTIFSSNTSYGNILFLGEVTFSIKSNKSFKSIKILKTQS